MQLETAALLLLSFGGAFSQASPAGASPFPLAVDFPSFLARADPFYFWNSTVGEPPVEWVSALFGGNGGLGFLLFQPTPSALRLDISRQDVYDDRTAALGPPKFLGNFVFDQPRLPVGHFDVTFDAPIAAGSGRISLFSAVSTLSVTTASGAVLSLAVWACAAWDTAADVVAIEATWSGSGGGAPSITWVPDVAESTWSGRDARYVPNPPPLNSSTASLVNGRGGTLNVTTQPHLAGTAHSTAVWQGTVEGGVLLTLASISAVLASSAAADAAAAGQALAGVAAGLPALRAAHEAWWAAWWPAGGFLTLEDSVVESFVAVQQYKFASGARRGRSVHDLEGAACLLGAPTAAMAPPPPPRAPPFSPPTHPTPPHLPSSRPVVYQGHGLARLALGPQPAVPILFPNPL